MGISKKGLIFGRHPVLEALNSEQTLEKVLVQKGTTGEQIKAIYAAANASGTPVQNVPADRLRRFPVSNHQGVVAFVSPVEYQNIGNIIFQLFSQGVDPLVLVLDRITDVRNFGAIARTAECLGVHAILVPNKDSAPINADAIKTSAGALMKIPVCRCKSLADQLRELKNSGLTLIACTEKADKMLHEADLTVPTALIMGSEESGVSKEVLQLADELIKVPMVGSISSLNVSVAAGMALYEARKQRG